MNHIMMINLDSPDYWDYCFPTIQKYADKVGVDIHIIGDDQKLLSDLHPKLHLLTYISEWADTAADNDRLLFIDGDIIVKDDAPNLFEFDTGESPGWVWMSEESCEDRSREFAEWVVRFYNVPFKKSYTYCNSGLVMVDGAGARKIKKWLGPPYLLAVYEQHQFNAAVHNANVQRMIPLLWHKPPPHNNAYFLHFEGKNKLQRIKDYLQK